MVKVIQMSTLGAPALPAGLELQNGLGGHEANSLSGVGVHLLTTFVSQPPVFLLLTNTPSY